MVSKGIDEDGMRLQRVAVVERLTELERGNCSHTREWAARPLPHSVAGRWRSFSNIGMVSGRLGFMATRGRRS